MSSFLPAGGTGTGGGIVYPDSASRPFNSNTARNNWANNNKQDLIKDTTVVNVNGTQWYLWTGDSNPDTVQTSLWMDANQIVPGEQGIQGDPGIDVTSAAVDGNGDLIVTLSDGSNINAGLVKGADGLDGVDVTSANVEANGDLVITLSDNSTVNAGNVTDSITHDGNVTKAFVSGDGLTSNHDPATNETTLHVEPLLFDANPTVSITSGTGITATHDPATNEVSISADIPSAIDLSDYQEISAQEIDYPSIKQDGNQVANLDDVKITVDGSETTAITSGTGITSTQDPATGEVTLNVDPTNIDLSDYAQLDTDVSFTKVTVKNPTDPLFESTVNVTNGGNTEANLVGTTNIRKVDKTTGVSTDVMNINGTSGAVDLRTDVTYQGAITDDKSPVTKEYLETFGRGIGVPGYVTVEGGNTYQQASHIGAYQSVGTNINDVVIQLDSELLEAEVIISMPADSYATTKNFDVIQIAGQGTSKNIRSGDTWRVRMILDQAGTNRWFWEKVYTGGGNVVYGLAGRLDIIEDVSTKAFAYAEGMPYHLLLETPTSSRLFHEFPRTKTFRFTPISTGREHDGNIVINQANQGVATGDLGLGQYSDLPLYIIEPNVVVNRDQRAWINFPANMTLDTSEGFYVFGTVSGWCGNSSTEGNIGVYVGTSENFRSYTQNIGFVLGNSGVFILDGQNLRTAQNSASFGFNVEAGVTHMYRYAFYVDMTGLMTYYIIDLNTGQVSAGTQQCNLSSIGSNPKLYISYDRYSNNTAAIAIAETHLVVNPVGGSEGRWNWRN
ncbi:MAG: hypothetical protein GY774_20580 [Planctomycetes bacterium]|nr:hypothetical protein [Planctomycetota bacterium]